MNVERLTRMRDLLRADAANPTGVKFDLGTWAEPATWGDSRGNWSMPPDTYPVNGDHYSEPETVKVKVDCGTKACAFGLAAISGEFAKEGLTYRFLKSGVFPLSGSMIPSIKGAFGHWQSGMSAAAVLFDVTVEDACYFFDPQCYDDTPQEAEGELQVAQRIDDFLNGIIDEDQHLSFRDHGDNED